MTNEQFREWYAHHQAAFPGIGAWLAKFDRVAPGDTNAIRSEAVLRSWRRVLADVDLTAAKAATDAMAKGDIDEPRSFDSHAKAVRKAANATSFAKNRHDERPQYAGGQQVFKCKDCLDSGLILVWHPRSMQAMRDGSFGGRFTRYSCGVKCNCTAGHARHRNLPPFDPKLMCPCDYHPTPEDDEALRAFVGGQSVGTEWDGGGLTYDAFSEGP